MTDEVCQLAQLHGDWHYPTAIRFGAGRLSELPQEANRLGFGSSLFVTDPGLVATNFVIEAIQALKANGNNVTIFSQLQGNPTGENVSEGVTAYHHAGHDSVIVLGGGSALDVGKAVALMAGQSLPIWSFEDCDDNWQRVNAAGMSPVIAIPSTSGTGSEVGRSSVITHVAENRKKIIFHPNMMPKLVIADPAITVGLPSDITAATGIDAFVHNFEAFCAPGYHPMATGIALEGMALIKNNLLTACRTGDDLVARSHLMVASTMGATAFQKGLGGVHALAHSLGALYNAHHGLLNAILLPYVIERNFPVIERKLVAIAQRLNLADASASGFVSWLEDFLLSVNIPPNLRSIGIGAEQAQQVGEMAVNDAAAAGNPVLLSAAEYTEIFVAAVEG